MISHHTSLLLFVIIIIIMEVVASPIEKDTKNNEETFSHVVHYH